VDAQVAPRHSRAAGVRRARIQDLKEERPMKTFVLLAACGLAMASGCQVSGDKQVDTTHRPAAAAAPAPTYTMTYEATRDTEWAASTDASAARGTLRVGDRVMFSHAPDTSTGWQQARLSDGTVRWVRPADFRAAASR
jgi:hypothetical protein